LKLEAIVDGRPARLEFEASRLRYQREGDDPIEREFSAVPLNPGAWSILIGGRSYTCIASGGVIRVNGRAFSVDIFDPRAMRTRKTGGAGEGRQNIAAMMPGKVVRVLVAEGDTVEAGQGLVVVEAMKMQNEMKSPKAGRVIEVKAKPDATVAAGQVLLVIE
jgi:acetyl/propionyl-CoA carboxylase alpha subunit